MEEMEEIAEGCVSEALIDYVGLWQIIGRVRRKFPNLGEKSQQEIAINIVRIILTRGLVPGDYLKSGFKTWPETDHEKIFRRITGEWDFIYAGPSLEYPICWFALPKRTQV